MPTSGHAYLQGRSILTEQTAIRRSVGYCPQHDALEPLMSCRETLRMYARIKGVPRAEIEVRRNGPLGCTCYTYGSAYFC